MCRKAGHMRLLRQFWAAEIETFLYYLIAVISTMGAVWAITAIFIYIKNQHGAG